MADLQAPAAPEDVGRPMKRLHMGSCPRLGRLDRSADTFVFDMAAHLLEGIALDERAREVVLDRLGVVAPAQQSIHRPAPHSLVRQLHRA
jgi:hypothetical protein